MSYADFKAVKAGVTKGGKSHMKSRKGKEGWKTMSEALCFDVSNVRHHEELATIINQKGLEGNYYDERDKSVTGEATRNATKLMVYNEEELDGPEQEELIKQILSTGAKLLQDEPPVELPNDNEPNDDNSPRGIRETKENEVKVFNQTDGVFASPKTFPNDEAARLFIDEYLKTFIKQGFYLTASGDRIAPKDVQLFIQPA